MLEEPTLKGPSGDRVNNYFLQNACHMMKIDNFSIQNLQMNYRVVTMKVLESRMIFEKQSYANVFISDGCGAICGD
jgi:hypothetical protein